MKWTALESKMLSAAAYQDSKQILYLRFRNTGDVYRYFEFPTANYQAFRSPNQRGVSSALTSVTTSVTSAWPNFAPPD